MTQTHCSLGNKAALWELPGQWAGGRKIPWELGVGVVGGGTLQGAQEPLLEAGVRVLRYRERSRDGEGSGESTRTGSVSSGLLDGSQF